MSKQRKQTHNPRNPNTCRICLTNNIGKTRLAYGHTVCQACSKVQYDKPNKAESNTETKGGNDGER